MYTEWIRPIWDESVKYRIEGKIDNGIKYHRHNWINKNGKITKEKWVISFQFQSDKEFINTFPIK